MITIELKKGELLWGGRVHEGTKMPYAPGFTADLHQPLGNQENFLLLSNMGRVIYSDRPFVFTVGEDKVFIEPDGEVIERQAGTTLREAYLYAMNTFYPQQAEHVEEELFRAPQFNTWIELIYNQNQKDILAYAERIAAEGFPRGVLMIDDNWQEDYGVWRFHEGRFPDPKGMMDRLHELGFKVMLWVCPFVSPDCLTFREMERDGLFVRRADGEVHIAHWWNGYSAVLDLTRPADRDWFKAQMDYLQNTYGVDGFKFDAGGPDYYPDDCKYHVPGASSWRQTQQFTLFAAQYPFSELRETCNQPQYAAAERLCDKTHSWTKNGLATLIPNSIAQSIMGYQMICPDMIGGGEYANMTENADRLDQELIVRSTQASALLPMMQFSAAPWRILNKDNYACCMKAVDLHTRFADYIVRTVEASLTSREPVVQPLEYAFPHQGLAHVTQQFMLGEKLMVAPVMEKGAKTMKVTLPEGRWTADDGQVYQGGREIEIATPIDRLPFFTR